MASKPFTEVPIDVGLPAGSEDDSISLWFTRAAQAARAVAGHHVTFDEATRELVGAVNGITDIVALQRAAWDAETILGPEAAIAGLLGAAVSHATSAHR